MAVLAEGISVVVRLDAIARLMDDEWANFVAIVPNQTLCCDNELARVGFMDPKDVEAFVHTLEARGFRYVEDSKAVDLVVIDQMRGPAAAYEWLEWGTIRVNESGEKITACRLKGGEEEQLFTPEGWAFEGSLSSGSGSSRPGLQSSDTGFCATRMAWPCTWIWRRGGRCMREG